MLAGVRVGGYVPACSLQHMSVQARSALQHTNKDMFRTICRILALQKARIMQPPNVVVTEEETEANCPSHRTNAAKFGTLSV